MTEHLEDLEPTEKGKDLFLGKGYIIEKVKVILKNNPDANEKDLFIQVEKHLGEEIFEEICIPKQIFEGAAIVSAIYLAKNGIIPDGFDNENEYRRGMV